MSRDIDDLRNPECGALVGEGLSGYGHDEAMADIFDLAHIETEFEGHDPRVTSLAAYIESLEAEVKRSHDAVLALTGRVERLEAERDALRAEHEAVKPGIEWGEFSDTAWDAAIAAHDNAERVIHGE